MAIGILGFSPHDPSSRYPHQGTRHKTIWFHKYVSKIFRYVHPCHFYKKRVFLEPIIRKIKQDHLNEHDIILFTLYNIHNNTKDYLLKSIGNIIEKYKATWKIINPSFEYKIYHKCYDHEDKNDFYYPKNIINGLQLFDVCNHIKIELTNRTPVEKQYKTRYKPSYEFIIREYLSQDGTWFKPLSMSRYLYPQRSIRDKLK